MSPQKAINKGLAAVIAAIFGYIVWVVSTSL
jgi:hypothetical protein